MELYEVQCQDPSKEGHNKLYDDQHSPVEEDTTIMLAPGINLSICLSHSLPFKQ